MSRTRPHVPRTGRRRKLLGRKGRAKLGKRNPRQLAAATGRRRTRRVRGR